MGADEKFVREHWDGARFESVLENSATWLHKPQIQLPSDRGRILCDRPQGGVWILSGNANTLFEVSKAMREEECWSAAAEYTRNRLEEIRRLESDIEHIQEQFADPFEDGWGDDDSRSAHYESPKYEDGIYEWLFDKNYDDGDIRQFVKESYRAASIITRLQEALAELKRGMR